MRTLDGLLLKRDIYIRDVIQSPSERQTISSDIGCYDPHICFLGKYFQAFTYVW